MHPRTLTGLLVAASLSLAACGDGDAETTATPTATATPEAGVKDLRMEFPAPPEFGEQIVTPEMVIPRYSEALWCFFSTFEGDDIGIESAQYIQPQFGHHVLFMRSHADESQFPDGTVFDCTDAQDMVMTEMEPIVVTEPMGAGYSEMRLPEGMAVKVKKGWRILIQSHYVNTSGDDILVQDAINLGFRKPEEVRTWVAPFSHTIINMPLNPSEETTINLKCTWEEDFHLLFLTGHMHELGTRFSIDWTHGEETERIYDIPTWDVEYRDAPPVLNFEEGAFEVKAGDTFTTSCSWFNTEDSVVDFPAEMCANYGLLYERTVPYICVFE